MEHPVRDLILRIVSFFLGFLAGIGCSCDEKPQQTGTGIAYQCEAPKQITPFITVEEP